MFTNEVIAANASFESGNVVFSCEHSWLETNLWVNIVPHKIRVLCA